MRGLILNIPKTQIADGELRLHQFRSTDPVVVELVAPVTDPEAAVRSALSIGARALSLAAGDGSARR